MSTRAEKKARRRIKKANEMWEQSQIKAASIQSALDYAVDQFNKHKAELSPEIIEQTEEMIALRQKEIREYLMKEKEQYLERLGIQQD